MSGIASILHLDEQPVAREQIEQLVRSLTWRGPDHQEVWVDGSVAAGAVQLWTTPEDWGTFQPLITPQGDCIVLDGRLDNRTELGQAIKIAPADLQTMSDAELLWATYKQWGSDCVLHLAGAFAFVIWDNTRQTLFAARDPLGMRTFFYFWNGRRFYGASTLQALLDLPFLERTLDKEYIWDFLTSTFMGSFDPEATPLQEIRRLPGGYTLQLNQTGLQIARYWQPWNLPPIRYKKDAEYGEHFRELFNTVIASHCRAVGPIGAALSGGLDSSAVVCLVKELERAGRLPAQDLHTFTVLFNQALRDQVGPFIHPAKLDVLGDKYDVTIHKIECDDWLPLFAELPYRSQVPQDEPFIILSRPYRNMGYKIKDACPDVRVILTGLGADEALAGSLFFIVDWLRNGRFRETMQAAKQIATYSPLSHFRILLNLAAGGLGPRSWAYRLRQQTPGPWDMDLGFRYHFRVSNWLTNQAPRSLEHRALERLKFIPKTFKEVSAQAAFERNILLLGDNVRLWDDQYIGTAAGLEMRHPFYDRRMIEFFLSLPTSQKIGPRGGTKHILRRELAETVPKPPPQVYQEEGEGFLYVYREGLKSQWPQIEKMFANSRAEAAGFIDANLFLEELGQKRTSRGSATDTEIIATLALEFWLRELEHIEQPAAANGQVMTTEVAQAHLSQAKQKDLI